MLTVLKMCVACSLAYRNVRLLLACVTLIMACLDILAQALDLQAIQL